MFLFDNAVTEAVTEAVSQAVTEAGTEATEAFEGVIPSTYDLTVQVPKPTLMSQIMSAVILILAIIALFIIINKRFKVNVFSMFGGIAVYLVFVYYAPRLIYFLYLIPPFSMYKESIPLYIGMFSVLGGVLGILGRILCMRLYRNAGNSIQMHASVALGMAGALGVYVAMNTFLDFINCLYIDQYGMEDAMMAMSASAQNQEQFEEAIKSLYTYVSIGMGNYIIRFFEYFILMLYHVAITIPLLAAYTDKESKGWYAFAMGTYVVLLFAQFLHTYGVLHGAITTVIMAVVVAGVGYFAVRMYKDYYQHEERKGPENNFFKGMGQEPPKKKKMPKFDNLKDL